MSIALGAGLEVRARSTYRLTSVIPFLWSSEKRTFDFHLSRKSHMFAGGAAGLPNPKWARFARE